MYNIYPPFPPPPPIHQSKQEATDAGGKKKDEKEPPLPPVPLSRLFYFADGLDVLLMTVGGIAAAGTGVIMPLFSLIFSSTINAINVGPDDERRANATKFSLYFVGLAGMSRTCLLLCLSVYIYMYEFGCHARACRDVCLYTYICMYASVHVPLSNDRCWGDACIFQLTHTKKNGSHPSINRAPQWC